MNCCKHPKVSTLMDKKHVLENGSYVAIPFVSKICLNCYAHIYGEPGNEKFYTRKEWDAWLESDEEAA